MKSTDLQLSQLERDFINRFQGDFPLQEQPFKLVADELLIKKATFEGFFCYRKLSHKEIFSLE